MIERPRPQVLMRLQNNLAIPGGPISSMLARPALAAISRRLPASMS
jgi:hypothetical protein